MSVFKNLSVTSGVFFFAVCVLSLTSAQNDLELSPQSDLESMEEIQELLQNVQLIFEEKIASKVRDGTISEDEEEDGDNDVDPNGCKCSGLMCSCCTRIRIKIFKIKDNCCLSVTYIPRNYGILVQLTVGRRRIFSKEVSGRKPPPICVKVPAWRKGASVCVEFYNLRVEKKSLSVCARCRATLLRKTVLKFKLGCFRINYLTNNTQQVDEVELPYLDVPEAPVEDSKPIYYGEAEMAKIKPAF